MNTWSPKIYTPLRTIGLNRVVAQSTVSWAFPHLATPCLVWPWLSQFRELWILGWIASIGKKCEFVFESELEHGYTWCQHVCRLLQNVYIYLIPLTSLLLNQLQVCLLIPKSISKQGVSNKMVTYLTGPTGTWLDWLIYSICFCSLEETVQSLTKKPNKIKFKIIELVEWKIVMGTVPLYGCCEALWCHSLKCPCSTISTRLYIQECTLWFLLGRWWRVSHKMVPQERSWAWQELQPTECEATTSADICLWQTFVRGHRDLFLSHVLKAFVLQGHMIMCSEYRVPVCEFTPQVFPLFFLSHLMNLLPVALTRQHVNTLQKNYSSLMWAVWSPNQTAFVGRSF